MTLQPGYLSALDERVLDCAFGHYPWDDWERAALAAGVPKDLAGLGRLTIREAYQHQWDDRLKSLCGWRDEGRRMFGWRSARPRRPETLAAVAGHRRLAGRIRRENRPVDFLPLTLMPWRIPEADIERVKRETDLLALVRSRGIELKKHGTKDFIGRCPFHDDQAQAQLHRHAGQGAVPLHGVRQGGQRHPVRAAPRRP